jgi:hypothetical protein
MMGCFIYLSPLLVGAVTVYVGERRERRSWLWYLWAPFVANVLYVCGTLLIMIEGLICAAAIVPLFAALGAVGGLLMGVVCRLTNWPHKALYSFGVLPLAFGALETGAPLAEVSQTVEREIVVAASPERIWREINDTRAIRPDEVRRAWLYRIGVPLPEAGITRATPEGMVRTITMGKSVHFEQVVTEWSENRLMRVRYRYAPDSFPPYALDEHVVLGGHYFDVTETSYELRPRERGTALRIRMRYRVSTPFNWYASPVARFLLGDFEEVILDFYRGRSEAYRAFYL